MIARKFWLALQSRASPAYEQLPGDGLHKSLTSWCPRLSRRVVILGIVCLSLLSLLITRRDWHKEQGLKQDNLVQFDASLFHVIIPDRETDVGFCRTTISAKLTGYPAVRLVNSDNHYFEDIWAHTSDEWAQFNATLRYLGEVAQLREDDLVLIASNGNSWFQLSPELVIQRYEAAIKSATKLHGRTHHVVFAAQKVCSGGGRTDVLCSAVPDSPLSPSTYSYTVFDDNSEVQSKLMADSRPRFLNDGFIMGRVASVFQLYSAAYDKWMGAPHHFLTQQHLFSTIYGEQESQRREDDKQRSGQGLLSKLLPWTIDASSTIPTSDPSKEYGITLDYRGQLAQVMTYAERDGSWIQHDNMSSIATALASLQISRDPTQILLGQDIQNSRPPYWTLAPPNLIDAAHDMRTASIAWSSTPLYTNLYTDSTPAILLHPDQTTPSTNLTDSWSRMWHTLHAPAKLTIAAFEPLYPLHTSVQTSPPDRDAKPGQQYSQTPRAKQYWPALSVTPVDKARVGIGFVLDDFVGAHNSTDEEIAWREEVGAHVAARQEWSRGSWRRWTEVCSAEMQSGVFVHQPLTDAASHTNVEDKPDRWTDPPAWPPFDDVEESQL